MEGNERYSEKVKRDINFSREVLIKFPAEVYAEFAKYAKENAGDCYWLAVKNLMEERKSNDKFDKLANRLDILEEIVLNKEEKQEEKKFFKGFGRE